MTKEEREAYRKARRASRQSSGSNDALVNMLKGVLDGLDVPDDAPDDNKPDDDKPDDDKGTGDNSPVPPSPDDSPDDEDKSRQERLKNFKENYGILLEDTVKTLEKRLLALYGNGYSGDSNCGILVSGEAVGGENSTVLTVNKSTGKMEASDIQVFLSKTMSDLICPLDESLKTVINSDNPKEIVPSSQKLLAADAKGICYQLHLAFLSGSVAYAKGKVSIRRFVRTKTDGDFDEWMKRNNGNVNRIVKLEIAKEWFRWCIDNIITDAIIDLGIDQTKDTKKMADATKQIERILSNAISVVEMNKTNVIIRISSGNLAKDIKTDADSILKNIKGIASKMSFLEGKNITHMSAGMASDGVMAIGIVLDEDKAFESTMFAGDKIGDILESGIVPSWSNALLGIDLDRNPLRWNKFKSTDGIINRCYTIYAGSRSGKGNITSSIITNALCDGVEVFYTDGKPETGAVLGELAWENGKEAYVFNGKPDGDKPFTGDLEQYTYGVRSVTDKTKFESHLPSVFSGYAVSEITAVMQYLQSIYLCASMIIDDSAGKVGQHNWWLWVFDECNNMASLELKIHKLLLKYCNKTYDKKLENIRQFNYGIFKKDQVEEARKDASLKFLSNFKEFVERTEELMVTANTIALGKSRADIMFIFQNAKWLSESDYKVTLIHKVVSSLRSTKIIGANALAKNCGAYGNAEATNAKWYSQYVSPGSDPDKGKTSKGTGYWGITTSQDGDLGKSPNAVKVFKPYSIWTVPLSDDMETRVDYSTLPEDKQKKYFKGYMTTLVNGLAEQGIQLDIPGTLELAYKDATSYVLNKGIIEAGSIKDFIYNPTGFYVIVDGTLDNTGNNPNERVQDIPSPNKGTVINSYDDEGSHSKDGQGQYTKTELHTMFNEHMKSILAANTVWKQVYRKFTQDEKLALARDYMNRTQGLDENGTKQLLKDHMIPVIRRTVSQTIQKFIENQNPSYADQIDDNFIKMVQDNVINRVIERGEH